MRGAVSVERIHDGTLVLSALVADGKACGPYLRTRKYQGYTVAEARRAYRSELLGNGGQFHDGRAI